MSRVIACLLLLAAACGHDAPPGGVVIDPDAPDELLFQEGLALYDQRSYAPAAAKFDLLLATYPSSPRHDNAGYLTGRSSYELALYPEAITKLAAMLAAHPDSPFAGSAFYFSGRARFRQGDFAPSVADFRASVEAD